MTDEAKELQNDAVKALCEKIKEKDEVTFKAPTGSGKTHMMADFMNRELKSGNKVFVVSSLSKGGLADQNHESFKKLSERIFRNLSPFLIQSDEQGEGRIFIPDGYNVYSLPRDLYKKKSRLKNGGGFEGLLRELKRQGEEIILIKDECHVATSNLDSLKDEYFSKVVNFSATPKLPKGKRADVEITEEEAVRAHLIKRKEMPPVSEWNGSNEEDLNNAFQKFFEVRKAYEKYFPNINPCIIIQISNKNKAEEEMTLIKTLLESKYGMLRWMYIVESEKKCETNCFPEKKTPPVKEWKRLAKENGAQVDVIIFKMTISEGWDIPRACMLFQMRDSKSKQLDEQVAGRVRRNPCLSFYEKLSPEERKVIDTAYVYGVKDENDSKFTEVKARPEANFSVKTTVIKKIPSKKEFDFKDFLDKKERNLVPESVFSLYEKYEKAPESVKGIFRSYAEGRDPYEAWFTVCENISELKEMLDTYEMDYENSMVFAKEGRETFFPAVSYMKNSENYLQIKDWLWKCAYGEDYYFDSEAEKRWASVLMKLGGKAISSAEIKDTVETVYMIGKNYLPDSEICYEYFQNGKVHASYPDFILKDKNGEIHIFESKSLNKASGAVIDEKEYEDKIRALKRCYIFASKKTGYSFYIPVLKNDKWHIWMAENGKDEYLSESDFIKKIKA